MRISSFHKIETDCSLQFAAQSAEEEVQRLRSEVDVLRSRTISPSECAPNPFASPAQGPPTCPTDIISAAGSHASASAVPMETMYCSCCGFQNVVGRPSCWKCHTMFNATIANNGADLTHARSVSGFAGQMQAASVVPSSFIASQVPLPCASNAATAQGCAFIAAKPGSLVSGGHAPVASVGPAAGIIPPRTPMLFDPHGPRIQGGHIVGNAFAGRCGSVHGGSSFHGCAGIPSGDPPEPAESKDPVANLDTKFFRMHSSTVATSEGSDDYVPQVPRPTPPGDWLLPGETDENEIRSST